VVVKENVVVSASVNSKLIVVHLVCPWLRLCPGVSNSTQSRMYEEKLEEKDVSPFSDAGRHSPVKTLVYVVGLELYCVV